MSPSHADDAPHGPSDSDAAKAQGTATSSEVVAKPPPTLQNRRVLVISDANQGASSGTDTATSSQTAAENGGEYELPGLQGLTQMLVQNKSMRILPNHTKETFGCLISISRMVDKLEEEKNELTDDSPRKKDISLEQATLLDLFHSLARGINDTLSRPQPWDRDTKMMCRRASEFLSPSFRGEKGSWLKHQELGDFSQLLGSMAPIEAWSNGLVQNKHTLLGIASEKSDIGVARKYKGWLASVLNALGHLIIRPAMLAGIFVLFAVKKLGDPTPQTEVLMFSAFLALTHIATRGISRSLEVQMLLTVTMGSAFAEILS